MARLFVVARLLWHGCCGTVVDGTDLFGRFELAPQQRLPAVTAEGQAPRDGVHEHVEVVVDEEQRADRHHRVHGHSGVVMCGRWCVVTVIIAYMVTLGCVVGGG